MIANRQGLVPRTVITRSVSSRVTFHHRIITWLTCMLLWTSLGGVLGAAMDVILSYISFNYVYSPHVCLRSFIPWTLIGAAVVAAAATTGTRPPLEIRSMAIAAILSLAATIVFSVAWAGAAAWLIVPDAALTHLAPIRRVRFCDGLQVGAGWSFTLATIGSAGWKWIQRRPTR